MEFTGKVYNVGCVIGTRPEVIKMAPIIFLLQKSEWARVTLIDTAQHRDLLDDMLDMFQLIPDHDLNVMTSDQSLGHLTGSLCYKFDTLLDQYPVDILLAAGDTTTVFITSLLAFYHKIPFGHIEAGLRTHDMTLPFPEEINRILTAPLSTWHFAPTVLEQENLLKENIQQSKIYVTGNPVIDAMYWILENKPIKHRFENLHNIITVTTHRRENFGENLQRICSALVELTARFPDINFVLPLHPNPNVRNEIQTYLEQKERIHLVEPLKYDEFISLMSDSIFVMTDSGGVQEEAPALKKPVIVMRESTERSLVIKENLGILAGTEKNSIVECVSQLLTDASLYQEMSRGCSPYGDGHSAKKIIEVLKQHVLA